MLPDCHRKPRGNFCNFIQSYSTLLFEKNKKKLYHSDLRYAEGRKKNPFFFPQTRGRFNFKNLRGKCLRKKSLYWLICKARRILLNWMIIENWRRIRRMDKLFSFTFPIRKNVRQCSLMLQSFFFITHYFDLVMLVTFIYRILQKM